MGYVILAVTAIGLICGIRVWAYLKACDKKDDGGGDDCRRCL